jgi:hypothetical protein
MACYTGPAGTLGVGLCAAGTETCDPQGTAYGACTGEVTPVAEDCEKGGDQACAGLPNNGCGKLVWGHDFGTSSNEEAYGVAVDPATDDVVISGYTDGDVDFGCGPVTGNAGDALFVAKLDAAGNCVWSQAWGAGALASWLAVDPMGDIYLGGPIYGTVDLGCGALSSVTGSPNDVLVAKLSSSGACLWSKVFGDSAAHNMLALELDSAYDVVLVGSSAGSIDFGGGNLTAVGSSDAYVAKLDTNGNYLWAERFGTAGSRSAVVSLAIDGADDVFISGEIHGTVDFGCGALTSLGLDDVFVAKLGPAGACVWSKSFGATVDSDDGDGLGLDSAGNVVLVGEFEHTINLGGDTLTSQGISNIFLAKFDANGDHLWSESFGGSGDQYIAHLAIDAHDAIVISGENGGTVSFGGPMLVANGPTSIFVAKYDTTGAYIWSSGFGVSGTQSPRQTAFDGAGNVLFSGLSTGPVDFGDGALANQGGEDIIVAKLAP